MSKNIVLFSDEKLNNALLYYYQEDFKKAKEYLENILAENSSNYIANFYLGHILQLAKKLKEARKFFNAVIEITENLLQNDNNDIELKYYLGAAYGALALMELNPFNITKYKKIFFTQMDEVLQKDENYFFALWAKGRALAITGKENEALEYLQKAYQICPLGDIQVDLGLFYIYKMQFEKAEECLNKALVLKPNSPTVYYNLYFLYTRKKDKAKAAEVKGEYEKLLKERKV